MAEIKSTLDLVMERTKNLTLSEDEKKANQSDEIKKRMNGLIQQYADGVLKIDHFERALENLDAGDLDRNGMLTDELLGKIDLERDNDALFDLLEKICGASVKKLTEILDDYGHAMNTAKQKRVTIFRTRLQKTHSISGSAVLPDLKFDEEWQLESAGIRTQFEKKLAKGTDSLKKRGNG